MKSEVLIKQPKRFVCFCLSIIILIFVMGVLSVDCYDTLNVSLFDSDENTYVYVPYLSTSLVKDNYTVIIDNKEYKYQMMSISDDIQNINNTSYLLVKLNIKGYSSINNLIVNAKIKLHKFKLYQKILNTIMERK